MRLVNSIILCLLVVSTYAQNKYVTDNFAFDAQLINASQIPKEFKYENNIQFALKWNDKKGDNYFIVTISNKELKEVERDTIEFWEVYNYNAYLYIRTKERETTPWPKNQDGKGLSCRSGVLVSVIKNTVSVTDIDKDSIAEVVFASRWRCRNDSVPTYANIELKIFEFETIYSIEGIGFEEGTKNKELSIENVCCIDSITKYYPISIDSSDSPKSQGLIKNFLNIKHSIVNPGVVKEEKSDSLFIEYAKRSWVEILKKEFEEYQEIKKLQK